MTGCVKHQKRVFVNRQSRKTLVNPNEASALFQEIDGHYIVKLRVRLRLEKPERFVPLQMCALLPSLPSMVLPRVTLRSPSAWLAPSPRTTHPSSASKQAQLSFECQAFERLSSSNAYRHDYES